MCALSVLYLAAGFGLAELFNWDVWLGLLVVGLALLLVAWPASPSLRPVGGPAHRAAA